MVLNWLQWINGKLEDYITYKLQKANLKKNCKSNETGKPRFYHLKYSHNFII